MENKYAEIGQRLKFIRGEAKQPDFAKALKVSLHSYVNYEKGYQMPPGDVLTKAAEFGKTTVDWILTGQERPGEKKGTFVAEDSAEYEFLKIVRAMPKSKMGMARNILKAMIEEDRKKETG
jgi:transcriptional regulator with XRE-family HTH domain